MLEYEIKEIKSLLMKSNYTEGYPKITATCFNENIFTKVLQEIKEKKSRCKTVTIMSPFYENDREKAFDSSLIMSFLNLIRLEYPKSKINVCFPAVYDKEQDKFLVSVPENVFKELLNTFKDIGFYTIPREWNREDNEEPIVRTFHAKLIYAELENGYNLYLSGSVNFTNNAMMSNLNYLRNMEVGVINYSKAKLILPQCTKIPYSKLLIVEKNEHENIISCFVDIAIFDGTNLTIHINMSKAVVPFEIYYNDRNIKIVNNVESQIVIKNFSLKKQQDIKIMCQNFSFYVPILIPNKENIITEDFKISFDINMKDIIDYLSGRYKSMSELKRIKEIVSSGDLFKDNMTIFFRQNLLRFYKALDTLRKGLEKPYYTEYAFINFINEPIGLKNLISLILKDYKESNENNKDSNDEETFLYLVEIWNVIEHLSYQEDWVNEYNKKNILSILMEEPKEIIKSITESATGNVKKQYQVLLKEYGLVV